MRWLLGLIGLPIFMLLVMLVFTLTDSRPSLSRSVQVGMADLDRGKAIFDSLGLRRMKEGEVRQLVLTEAELDKGVNYLAHRLAGGSASARIALSQLIVRASLPLPLLPRFINLELALASGNEVLQPAQLRLGKLKLPAALSGKLVLWGLAGSPYGEELAAARSLLDSAQLVGQNAGFALHLARRGGAENDDRRRVVRAVTKPALKPYRDHLDGRLRGSDFALLLGGLFALAQDRSKAGDPIAENRAALTMLAEKALGSRLLSKQGLGRDRPAHCRSSFPAATILPSISPCRLFLRRRAEQGLVQHGGAVQGIEGCTGRKRLFLQRSGGGPGRRLLRPVLHTVR
jgi:hypothetical protein